MMLSEKIYSNEKCYNDNTYLMDKMHVS